MPRWLKGLLVGVLTGLSGALLGLSNLGVPFERSVGLSWLFQLRGPITPPPEIAVVAIDTRTGKHLGLPNSPQEWPRSVHAKLVEALVQRGASSIVFDVLFDKPKSAEHDLAFAQAVAKAGRVVLVQKLTGKRQPITDKKGINRGSVWVEELVPPLPSLAEAAAGLGHFPLPKREAAVYEFWVFKASVGDAPSMPAVALQIHALKVYSEWIRLLDRLHAPDLETLLRSTAELTEARQLRDFMRGLRRGFDNDPGAGERIAGLMDQTPEMSRETVSLLKALTKLYAGDPIRYINFYGPPGTMPTIPYHAVIQGGDPNLKPGALDFTGKVVFVGFSDLFDPGQPDRFYTVFTREDGVDLSGVEIAATVFGNLLSDRTLKPIGVPETGMILLLFGLVMGTVVYSLPAGAGVPLSLLLAIMYGVAGQWMFNQYDVWAPMATPLLAQFPIALFIGLLGQYLLERRRGQQISQAISYYLPENIARDLTENRLDPSAANKVVYSTCLATDMSGFSSIAEKLEPRALASFLNDYFDTLAQPLKRHHVDVTEFRADAIMCAWTAAEPNAGPRGKAVMAALEAADAIARFKERHGMLGAKLRIGLESGWVYVGHAGGGGHFVYSIVGDCANTASRVEGLNKHIGTQLLATESVVAGLDNLLVRSLGSFQFVGKSEALPIMEIVATRTSASPDQVLLCERFSEALDTFQKAQWGRAADQCKDMLTSYPGDGPARFYLSLCERYQSAAAEPKDPRIIRMDAK
ncbi:MAG: CHASE2 domain-containing protein [Gammaproteobacteria bacterium]